MPRHNVHHGGISQVHCTLRLLNFVRDVLPDYDFIHSISGQDYPLRSNELFDGYFEHSNKGYMLFDSEALVQKWRDNKYADRVNYWHPNNRASILGKIYYRISLDKIVNRFIKRDTICGLRGGWSWFTWTPMITNYVLKYLAEHSDYLRRFEHSYCGDELIFATMLYPVAEELNLDIRCPLRYVSWFPKHRQTDVGSYFPYILNIDDFEDVYNSAAFFCRKVELPESANLLDMIDKNRNNAFIIENAEKIDNSESGC